MSEARMLKKVAIEQLVAMRLTEAVNLFESKHFSGAYYLGGYAIELGIKACIANVFETGTIPDKNFVNSIYVHNLAALIKVAGLEADLTAKSNADADFARHWEYVRGWSESARYELVEEEKSRLLIGALRDENHGVLQWIKTYW